MQRLHMAGESRGDPARSEPPGVSRGRLSRILDRKAARRWPWERRTRRQLLHAAGVPASIATAAMWAGMVGACSGPSAGSGSAAAGGEVAAPAQLRKGVTITWAVDSGPTRTPLRQDQTKLFNDKFPDIKVDFLEGATDPEKLQALFAAGTPPDLFRQETSGMALFAARGQITPLDPYLKRDRYDLSDFFPAAWELWKWKGKHLGVPFLGIRIAFYNRELVRQVGARVPPASWRDASWTWEAFLEDCQKVTQPGTRWGADLGTSRRDWQPWVWSNGGELFNADGTQVLLDQQPAIEALQFLADLINRYRVAPSSDQLKAQGGQAGLFQAGNLFLYHSPVNNVAQNRRTVSFDWSITALPRGKAKASASSGGGVGWFLSSDSKVKDETWELMKVLASKESVRLEAERGEAPPSRRSVANEPSFIDPPGPPGKDMKVVVEALEAMHVETALINGVEIDAILGEEVGPLWQGQKTAREAVAQAIGRIKPLLNPAG